MKTIFFLLRLILSTCTPPQEAVCEQPPATPAQTVSTGAPVKGFCWDTPEMDTLPFSISTRGLEFCAGEIQENQNLTQVFTNLGVSFAEARAMTAQIDSVWDVRRLKAFAPYFVLYGTGCPDEVRYFLYNISAEEYLVCHFAYLPIAYTKKRKVEVVERTLTVPVYKSLWHVLDSADADPTMAMSLAEVFQWSVDFFHLKPADELSLVFDEKRVDGIRRGSGMIKAARLTHNGGDTYAFGFVQDGVWRYFDEYGNTLQKAFLAAPLEYSRISSGYSLHRFHPILKVYTPHTGVDFAAPEGTPIHTVADGVILEAQYRGNNGNTIKIRHDETYMTQYLHLSGFAPGITTGARVSQGQVIGYVGTTGLSTGPHLCYRLYKNGEQVDPMLEKLPTGETRQIVLREENYLPFLLTREKMVRKMDPAYHPVIAISE